MFGNSEFDDKCGSCDYFRYIGSNYEGRCNYDLELHKEDEDKCWKYYSNYKRLKEEEERRQQEEEEERKRKEEEEERKRQEEEEERRRKENSNSGCYLTTLVCEMLGFDDKCDVLETLRSFRGNFLQKDSKYKELLFEYDTVGPKIAKAIREDEDYELINGMYNFYILPVVDEVKEKKYDSAVDKYVKMTRSLEDYYGIKFDGKVPENYDYKKGGHGKVLCL